MDCELRKRRETTRRGERMKMMRGSPRKKEVRGSGSWRRRVSSHSHSLNFACSDGACAGWWRRREWAEVGGRREKRTCDLLLFCAGIEDELCLLLEPAVV